MTATTAPPLRATALGRIAARAAAALLLSLVAIGAAVAQAVSDVDPADPPGRVGSITLLAGPVTMVDLATGSSEEALLNWPVTGGWRIDTGRAGRAEVRIGSTALRLDDETTVDFARLDDHFMQIAVLRGSVSLRLRSREVTGELEVLTQRERIVFEDAGRYRIDVDRRPGATALAVFAGRARIAVGGSTFLVSAGERGEVGTEPTLRYQVAAAAGDRFDDWAAARDARDDAIRSSAYVARETTGIESLDEYGDWRPVADYGPVWFPRVVVDGWAPYRYGRWVWIGPWGWTWIDDAPWGFAPLHYGRWAIVGGVWGWVPGVVVPRPVYASALVGWYSAPEYGVAAPIGWFPLGPREPYVPPHRHSPRYLRVVNVQHVPDVARVTIVQTPRYVHRDPGRSTWVAPDRFGRPGPVDRDRRPPPSEWRQYIARPQPPANVPQTKRRQSVEGTAPARVPTLPAAPAPAPSLPPVRAPMVVPRADEPSRAAETPRPSAAPLPRPAPPVTARPEARPGRVEAPPNVLPPPVAPPPAPPRGIDGRPGRCDPPAAAQPRPGPQPAAPPAAVAPPVVQPPRGRGETRTAPPDGHGRAPRSIEPPPATPAQPGAAAPPAQDPARSAGVPPPAGLPAPAPRTEGGHSRGGDRSGRGPVEATR